MLRTIGSKDLDLLIENFDLFSYLENRGIEYHDKGKNVSRGWIEITCPFDCPDPSWHCGINLETKIFNCWVCGTKGNLIKLIKKLEQCSYRKAIRILQDFQLPSFASPTYEKKEIKESYSLPKEINDSLQKVQINYLKKRGFNPEKLIEKYHLKPGGIIGKYRFRIIAPVIMNNEVKGFTALSPVKTLQPKYISSKNIKKLIYNIDNAKDKAIIVEGITDVWKIGDGCIAIFGKQLTSAQLYDIIRKKFKKIFIMLDGDAIKEAYKLASQLSPFISEVEVIELPFSADPASLSEEEIKEIKRLIN